MELFAGFFVIIWLVMMVVAIGGFVLWIIAIIELVKMPEPVWGYAGVDKTTWLLLVILLGWIGAIVYWFSPRKRLLAAKADLEARGMLYAAPPQAYGYPPQQQYGYPPQQQQYGYAPQPEYGSDPQPPPPPAPETPPMESPSMEPPPAPPLPPQP